MPQMQAILYSCSSTMHSEDSYFAISDSSESEWGTAPCRGVPECPWRDAQSFYRMNDAVYAPLLMIYCQFDALY